MDFKSRGGGGGGGGGAGGEPPVPPPLARQGSVYTLTMDELQNTLGGIGKDFGSMNMDELLRNIWTAEESYAMTVALGDGSGPGSGLQRQGSLTLPRTLSQKTVDEVWRDLGGHSSSCSQVPAVRGADVPRQSTLGEMTLEEFLVRAGVVREDMTPPQAPSRPANNTSNDTSVFYGDLPAVNSSAGLDLGFSQAPAGSIGNIVDAPIPHGSAANLGMTVTAARPYAAPMTLGNGVDLANPQGMTGGGLVGFGHADVKNGLTTGILGLGTAGVFMTSGSPADHLSSDRLGKGNGDLSSVSPVPYVFSGGMRGRKGNGTLEKVVERRQRRMIKNRESAARSRARKQRLDESEPVEPRRELVFRALYRSWSGIGEAGELKLDDGADVPEQVSDLLLSG
ncbi:hypothetical protein GW17_00027825 [Ensete ventricosum]|nr:hypothetical protein GW17_00027825 [Ensete ventricosum]